MCFSVSNPGIKLRTSGQIPWVRPKKKKKNFTAIRVEMPTFEKIK